MGYGKLKSEAYDVLKSHEIHEREYLASGQMDLI